ncbi:MAG: hypothetical protein QOG17_2323, partial [Gammaproteobacteria bacterium]|nr:hypothetical protein [Gammaproteobacteria bacterium]
GLLVLVSLAACAPLRPSPPPGAVGTAPAAPQETDTVKNGTPPPAESPAPAMTSAPNLQPPPAGQAATAESAPTPAAAKPPAPAATSSPAKAAGAAKAKAPSGKTFAKTSPTDERTAQPAPQASAATASEQPKAEQPKAEQPKAPPALDLASLEQRLRDTHAIGVFTKLSLKNQVDDLLGAFRAYHGGQDKISLTALRQRFDLLLLKVLTLLQDGDPPLASAISSSREAIWGMLADREKFQKSQLG